MKKIYGFLAAAAVLMTAACSKDDVGDAKVPEVNKGDMFMTIDIAQSNTIGTRTSTPDQGIEQGKDVENKISTALVIFAKQGKVFATYTLGENDIEGVSSPYAGTFKVNRDNLLKDIEDNSGGAGKLTYEIYVVANPANDMTESSFTSGSDVQKFIELATDGNKYWDDDHFLMTNAYKTEKEIEAAEIPVGTHTTKTTAFDLGKVVIQRAMSRFDIDVDNNHTVFSSDPAPEGTTYGETDLNNITITLDAVSLVNQATKANLFKVTSENDEVKEGDNSALTTEWDTYKGAQETTLSFGAHPLISDYPTYDDETATNYVFSPIQTAFTLPLYADGTTITDGKYTKPVGTTVQRNLAELFGTGYAPTTFETLASADEDNTYTHPNDQAPSSLGAYRIWRYAMENTNYDKDNQYHGNTTGVVFRAIITGKKVNGEEINPETDGALYAYNNVFLGNAEALRTYVISNKSQNDNSGVYDIVNIRYKVAVDDYNNAQDEDSDKFTFNQSPEEGAEDEEYTYIGDATKEQLEGLDEYLVGREFAIYRPSSDDENGKYYCYYIYWNRHNDNTKNTIMGPMEFATVRNNVYKLAVTKIHKLGHPGDPDDDPDPDDPGDPDEKDEFYCTVQCVILPWEVRINGIEF